MKSFMTVLYAVALLGIIVNLLFHIKVVGLIGYSALCAASVIQIFRLLLHKKNV